MDNPRIKFYMDKKSFWAHGTGVLLVLAVMFQLVACWGLWNDQFFVLTQILLPVVSFLLFALLLYALGQKALWVTIIPFLGGLAFYGLRAWFAEERTLMMIGVAFCVLAAVLFVGTAFAWIRTKWLLVLLFAVPFCYRAFYRDVLLLQNEEQPVGFAAGMREISLLCVLLAMTLFALGLKKRVRDRRNREPQAVPAAPAPAPAPMPAPESSSTLTDVPPSSAEGGPVSSTENEGI